MRIPSLYRYILPALVLASMAQGCAREELAERSVVDQYLHQGEPTELDNWLHTTFSPYNISVNYLWNKQNLPVGSIATPPQVDKVRPTLEAVRDLWIKLYEQPKAGGANFIKDKELLRITLLGGFELQERGVLMRLWYPTTATNELFVFDVNNFDPQSKSSVYRLMRSIHHQFARRLGERIPYDRDAFASISPKSYGALGLAPNSSEALRRVGLSPYAHRRGFYTLHSMDSPEDEFAEIVSIMLLHSAVEIDDAEQTALRPIDAEQPGAIEEAQEAARVMKQKRAFVEEYFKKSVGISLSKLQILSLKQLNAYYTQHQTK